MHGYYTGKDKYYAPLAKIAGLGVLIAALAAAARGEDLSGAFRSIEKLPVQERLAKELIDRELVPLLDTARTIQDVLRAGEYFLGKCAEEDAPVQYLARAYWSGVLGYCKTLESYEHAPEELKAGVAPG